MKTTANPKYKILAFYGGDIRGIIPALILTKKEKRTQKAIFSLCNLITETILARELKKILHPD
ncbi:MAG: hypothetical protein RM347_022600 [Nostoc sp. ChiQUE02]|uniref:hypothetical protein n=1 Tax=Nostoc sp. ChiQUE02 TaxID=3075377 RepID=UPI002AD37D30|nr:hypothetical protein [Nostoc sp. ChiQUE02]MDZ8231346.1 hypothetical protein [Nostoc sp. ChiQUE02]